MSRGRPAFSTADERFMRRALALAERGRGGTRPNPIVGAVVVRGGRIIGEGYHRRAGEPHAEIHALAGLGEEARGATLYVTLEPCCHTGRTGPCTAALRGAGLARVVVGCLDPNPRVDGRGVSTLRRAGLRVDVGCLREDCEAANRAFFVWVRERRPLVTLKVAASLDGYIADFSRAGGRRPASPQPAWLTGPDARAAAHRLRAEHDAILVGAGTVLADDPRLTVRLPRRARGAAARAGAPWRIVLDGHLRTPPGAAVLGGVPGAAPTLVVTSRRAPAARVRALEAAGAEVLRLAPDRRGTLPIDGVLRALADREIQTLLVEGGAQVHGAFIDARRVDRVALFLAPVLLGGGVPIAAGRGLPLDGALRFGPPRARGLGGDLLVVTEATAGRRGRAGRGM